MALEPGRKFRLPAGVVGRFSQSEGFLWPSQVMNKKLILQRTISEIGLGHTARMKETGSTHHSVTAGLFRPRGRLRLHLATE